MRHRLLAVVVLALVVIALAWLTAAGVASLNVIAKVDVVGVLAREPMIVEHPDGSLFAAGYNRQEPNLWKSSDRGATWSRVNVGTAADGAVGNSDVDLAVARDGTLYFVNMTYDNLANAGLRIAIGVSRDAGTTWSWRTVSETRGDDRPWVAVAPDGTAHVIWNDGRGVNHVTSRDRGATWTRMPRVHDRGGSSHLAVGPSGEVAVRITPLSKSGFQFDEGVDLVAVSTDGGTTWRKHVAPGDQHWTRGDLSRWVEPVAWDGRGTLYTFWTADRQVWLARSRDRGATWEQWKIAETTDKKALFPYLVGRADGELAATWFTGGSGTPRWHAATIHAGRGDAAPRTIESQPLSMESERPGRNPGDPPVPDPGGEYLGVAFLRDGSIGVVTPIQHAPRFGFTWWNLREGDATTPRVR